MNSWYYRTTFRASYEKQLVVGYTQIVNDYRVFGQILSRTRHQPDSLTMLVIQHVRDDDGQRGIGPMHVGIERRFRDEPQRQQIALVHHQFFLLRDLQVVLKAKRESRETLRTSRKPHVFTLKFLKLLICLCVSVTSVSIAGRLRLFWNIMNSTLNENTATKQNSMYRDLILIYCNLNIGPAALGTTVGTDEKQTRTIAISESARPENSNRDHSCRRCSRFFRTRNGSRRPCFR